jgi:hypothetical protein
MGYLGMCVFCAKHSAVCYTVYDRGSISRSATINPESFILNRVLHTPEGVRVNRTRILTYNG